MIPHSAVFFTELRLGANLSDSLVLFNHLVSNLCYRHFLSVSISANIFFTLDWWCSRGWRWGKILFACCHILATKPGTEYFLSNWNSPTVFHLKYVFVWLLGCSVPEKALAGSSRGSSSGNLVLRLHSIMIKPIHALCFILASQHFFFLFYIGV